MSGRKLRRAGVLTLATAAAALAVPAVAGASTFCVGPASCTGSPKGDGLQLALSAAQANPGFDEVLVSDRGSEERRVGKECGYQCRSRWSPYH